MNTTELYESTLKSQPAYTSSADDSANKPNTDEYPITVLQSCSKNNTNINLIMNDFIDDSSTTIENLSKVSVQSNASIDDESTIIENLSKVPVQSNASIDDDAPFTSGDENDDKPINIKKFDVVPVENNSPIDDDTSGDDDYNVEWLIEAILKVKGGRVLVQWEPSWVNKSDISFPVGNSARKENSNKRKRGKRARRTCF